MLSSELIAKPFFKKMCIRDRFRSLWQNRFMAVASIAVLMSCLLLTGGAYLVFVNIDHAFDMVYEQNVVVAFAKEDLTEEQTQALGEKLKSITNVADVEFVSKEESLQKYADSIPDATFESLQGENNPLLDTYVVAFEDLSKFDATLAPVSYTHLDVYKRQVRRSASACGNWTGDGP